jgi:hypothetical protein
MNLLLQAFSFEPSTGGGERVRTDDLLRARQALSQLSYTPNTIDDLVLTIENPLQLNSIFNLQ